MCEISLLWFLTPSEIAWLKICKVTLVACVGFTQMLFNTCPLKLPAWTVTIVADVRNLLLTRWKVAKVADAQKFLVYDFQTPSQITWLNRCKVTLVACVQRNPNVILHKSSKIACLNSHNSCRCAKFLHYDFKTPSQIA